MAVDQISKNKKGSSGGYAESKTCKTYLRAVVERVEAVPHLPRRAGSEQASDQSI